MDLLQTVLTALASAFAELLHRSRLEPAREVFASAASIGAVDEFSAFPVVPGQRLVWMVSSPPRTCTLLSGDTKCARIHVNRWFQLIGVELPGGALVVQAQKRLINLVVPEMTIRNAKSGRVVASMTPEAMEMPTGLKFRPRIKGSLPQLVDDRGARIFAAGISGPYSAADSSARSHEIVLESRAFALDDLPVILALGGYLVLRAIYSA